MQRKLDNGGDGVTTIVTRSIESAWQTSLSMPALSNVRFRARNRPPLSDYLCIILSQTLCLSVKFPCFLHSLESSYFVVIDVQIYNPWKSMRSVEKLRGRKVYNYQNYWFSLNFEADRPTISRPLWGCFFGFFHESVRYVVEKVVLCSFSASLWKRQSRAVCVVFDKCFKLTE